MVLKLEVERQGTVCQFKLLWGEEQQLVATVHYPDELTTRYQVWQHSYLDFYRTLSDESVQAEPSELRGRLDTSGSVTPPVDRRLNLVKNEAKLRSVFYRWLNDAELAEIRRQIVTVAFQANEQRTRNKTTDLFLICHDAHLERLPWETWEVGVQFAPSHPIRIARSPVNIQAATTPRSQRGKPRILTIFGDDTGLNFQADRAAMQSLSGVAEVHVVSRQAGQTVNQTITMIIQAIADDIGWDLLFFSGHSQENSVEGGEFAIAPGVSISLNEIEDNLTLARNNGLQVAIFNSCSGLSIARSVIGLGLSQVVVMREPIHNQVAQQFLVRLLKGLTIEQKDVHDALISACQFLGSQRKQTYPSAYLIPSLFRHPGATLFQWRSSSDEHQESDPAPKPLLPQVNPFNYGIPVLPESFYGQIRAIADLRNRIGARTAQSINIVGHRRSGKTSLLRYIQERKQEFFDLEQQNPVLVSLDLQNSRFHTSEGILDGLRLGILRITGATPWGESESIYTVMDCLEQFRRDYRLIVMFDEFEALGSHLEKSQDWGDTWRSMACHELLTMVIASKRPLHEVYQQAGLTSPFSNIFSQTILGALEELDWQALVRDGLGSAVADEVMDWINRSAGGIPFYVQMAASLFWQLQDLALVETEFSHQARQHFQTLWGDLTEREQRVVQLLINEQSRGSLPERVVNDLRRYGVVRLDSPQLFSSAFVTWLQEER